MFFSGGTKQIKKLEIKLIFFFTNFSLVFELKKFKLILFLLKRNVKLKNNFQKDTNYN